MVSDIHVHSLFSSDSKESMENHIERAIELKMSHIGFSDHQDYDAFLLPPENYNYLLDNNGNTEAYLQKIHELRETYKERITVLAGVELGIRPHLGELLRTYVSRHSFDYIIASTHGFNGYDGGDRRLHEGKIAKETITGYLSTELENMKAFRDYDIWGHLDYIVRHTPGKCDAFFYDDYRDLLEEILKLLVSEGKGLDCNTNLLSQGWSNFHPHRDILKRYRELGGEIITFGSDAHEWKGVGRAFDKAVDIAKECGFTYYAVFEERKPIFLPL